MDAKSANILSKSIDKVFYLGLTFGALFACKIALEFLKTTSDNNSKTNSSKPYNQDNDDGLIRQTRTNKNNSSTNKLHKRSNSPNKNKTFSSPISNIDENEDYSTSSKINKKTNLNKDPLNELSGNEEKTTIIKICFTGGPCAGKTTAISSVANMLRNKGFEAMCSPEAATLIFSSGGILDLQFYSVYQALQF